MKIYASFIVSLLLITSLCSAQQKDTIILDGYIERQDLKTYSWFDKNYDNYQPNKRVIKKLQKVNAITILVILGTWCSDSKEHVPALLKVADEAKIISIKLIAVNRKKKSNTVDVSSFNVEYVPLIIVYRNGKETGRIIETPKKSVEKDLLKILRQ